MATTKKPAPVKSEAAAKSAPAKAAAKKSVAAPAAAPKPTMAPAPAPAKTVATKWVVAKPAENEAAAVQAAEVKPVAAKPAAAKPVATPKPVAKSKPKAEAVAAAVEAPKTGMGLEQRAHYVEVAAFYIAERRGFASVNPMEDWLAAEAEIDRLIASGHFAQT